MSTPPDDFLAFLQARRLEYGAELPGKIDAIDALWHSVRERSGSPDLIDLERAAHSLAGTAGTFGFVAVSSAGKAMETALQRLAAADASALSALEREFEVALAAARQAIAGTEP